MNSLPQSQQGQQGQQLQQTQQPLPLPPPQQGQQLQQQGLQQQGLQQQGQQVQQQPSLQSFPPLQQVQQQFQQPLPPPSHHQNQQPLPPPSHHQNQQPSLQSFPPPQQIQQPLPPPPPQQVQQQVQPRQIMCNSWTLDTLNRLNMIFRPSLYENNRINSLFVNLFEQYEKDKISPYPSPSVEVSSSSMMLTSAVWGLVRIYQTGNPEVIRQYSQYIYHLQNAENALRRSLSIHEQYPQQSRQSLFNSPQPPLSHISPPNNSSSSHVSSPVPPSQRVSSLPLE